MIATLLRQTASWLLGIVGVAMIFAMATVSLTAGQQAILAVLGVVVFLIVDRFPGRGANLFLAVLSLAVSLRYLVWRFTETLSFDTWLSAVLGVGLIFAELYAVLVLVLGYFQTAAPLDRKPLPLPRDVSLWPSVDVYIPTYNEALSVVRPTVLAAQSIDWPPDRLRVYILDDGRRTEFREFARAAGCGYLIRPDNKHAKAGNLNHAMSVTGGEFIAIFDCDHIPTRAFLQMTVGWLVADRDLAMVQTPHHFYSPDPFQRNLAAGARVPAEGNLFYGLLQPGNDHWDAAFFCGSCAVLRRTALEEVGGVAVETVTEDAHTMLKMHRRGWSSAYLRLPLAAGLATERLMLHIGQRTRWARGMIQILRRDNPLLGPGLAWGQRLCYLQAMLHFLFALPRLVFLTSPLAYLLLYQNIFAASPLAILAYGMPHIIHAVATNSRIQKNWRHSFWSEIYETVLALFLVRMTIVTLWNPRHGKFNVTAKGGLLENGYFDLRAVYPNIILATLLAAGLLRGVVSLIWGNNDELTFQALMLNAIWALLSLLIVMGALAVGRETQQTRNRARVPARLPVTIYLADGRAIAGVTRDVSEGGSAIAAPPPKDLPAEPIEIEIGTATEPVLIRGSAMRWDERGLQVAFTPETIEEERAIVNAVFGRADAWVDWASYPPDHVFSSLWRVLVSIRGLFQPPDRSQGRSAGRSAGGRRRSARKRDAAVAAMVGLLILLPALAQAQRQTVIRPIPQPIPRVGELLLGRGAAPPPVQAQSSATQPAAATQAAQPLPPPATAASDADTAPATGSPGSAADGSGSGSASATPAADRADTRRVTYTLRELGANGPLTLRGSSALSGVQFGIRADEVVTDAQLTLSGAMSTALLPESSNDTVTLNEQYVGTIPVDRAQPNFSNLTMPVNPVFFQDNNRLNVRFAGRYTNDCNDPLSPLLWSRIADSSTLALTVQRLPPQHDLARLPQPFFAPEDKQRLVLPVVMAANAGEDALRAAGIVASWFGQLADYRGATFPVAAELPAEGNAVVLVAGGSVPDLTLPPINGPTIANLPNPRDPLASLLVVAGRNESELAAAATALAAASRLLNGTSATVDPPNVPARVPYDAPAWIPSDRPVRLGELIQPRDLQVSGYTGTVRVPFRTAPDLYTWRDRPLPLHLLYRAPPGPVIDLAPSRVDVGINGTYLQSFSLAGAQSSGSWLSRALFFLPPARGERVGVPPYDVFGANDLQFFFDARPLHRGDCVAIPDDLTMGIDPSSTLDLSRAFRVARLPNLAWFVNAGFPFTRLADLAETAVVLPSHPGSVTIGAFLDLMGRIGSLTGFPVLRLQVAHPDTLASAGAKDLLVISPLAELGSATQLFAGSPLQMVGGNRLDVTVGDPLAPLHSLFGASTEADREAAATRLSAALPDDAAVVLGLENRLAPGRSVVALLASTPQGLEHAVSVLGSSDQGGLIQGDLALLSGGQVTSYRVGPRYTVGTLPFWMWPLWYLHDQPIGVGSVLLLGCAILTLPLGWALRRHGARRTAHQAAVAGNPRR